MRPDGADDDMALIREKLLSIQSPYSIKAYEFVLKCLYTSIFSRGRTRHEFLTAYQFADNICVGILQEYGPFSLKVVQSWGINSAKDFGEIIRNLAKAGIIKLAGNDSPEYFETLLDLSSALTEPFTAEAPYPDIQVIH